MSKLCLFEHESEGQAPFRLHRLVEWAGLEWSDVDYFRGANLSKPPAVVLAMGQGAQEIMNVSSHNILHSRGYPYTAPNGVVIPTVSPAFIQAGNARWSAAFINDLQKAMGIARHGLPPQMVDYVLDPSPLDALRWAKDYRVRLAGSPRLRLAFDIETPGKGDEEDTVELGDAPDRTWHIDRIGFSYSELAGLSIPWSAEYRAAIRLLMESPGDKVVWNAGFDCPRIRRAGVGINGICHDGMVAWHILHTDLPKSLRFVATFTCPYQPAWKHLSHARPAYYNCTDADVEFRSMVSIERDLRAADLWKVYERDVVELEPVLVHMQQAGMPVDPDVRLDRVNKLAEKLAQTKLEMAASIPEGARKVEHVYRKSPKDTTGLLARAAIGTIRLCPGCGARDPKKPHFKKFVKKANPCASLTAIEQDCPVTEYYRLAEFTPSRDQFIRYHQWLKRPLPRVWDPATKQTKVSFNEASLRKLILKYPDDKLYQLVLLYRQVDKLAGTYVGRPA